MRNRKLNRLTTMGLFFALLLTVTASVTGFGIKEGDIAKAPYREALSEFIADQGR